jgi:YqaJ-like viral recombinase domain
VAFVDHPNIAMSGASPDGLVGSVGLLEIKCPETKKHIATIIANEAPAEYIPQMQWQMACTGRTWCDFVSFDPRLPLDLQLFIKRVHRDPVFIAAAETEVVQFLLEVDEAINRLILWKSNQQKEK